MSNEVEFTVSTEVVISHTIILGDGGVVVSSYRDRNEKGRRTLSFTSFDHGKPLGTLLNGVRWDSILPEPDMRIAFTKVKALAGLVQQLQVQLEKWYEEEAADGTS